MHINILTLFPEVFEPYLSTSIVGIARNTGAITTKVIDIREYTTDRHRTVDDTPYGGGAGMVMKIEPIHKALQELHDNSKFKIQNSKLSRTVVLAARGQQFNQAKAHEYSQLEELTLICGRYEGIDQRVVDFLADEELSIGPYVVAGGELPALMIVEAATRLIPGVLGNPESLTEESHSQLLSVPTSPDGYAGRGSGQSSVEYPQYTKPSTYQGWEVPKVLLSGNHAQITEWREQNRPKRVFTNPLPAEFLQDSAAHNDHVGGVSSDTPSS